MVWVLPSAEATFDVKIRDKIYHLPKLGEVTLDQIEALEGLNIDEETVTIAAMRAMFETIAPEFPVGSLTGTQLHALMTAWQKDSGVSLGESAASTRSSKSTAKR